MRGRRHACIARGTMGSGPPMLRAMLLLAALLALLTPVATASARTPIRVGIGDQRITTFDQPAFQRAHFRRVRFIVAWNVMDDAGQRHVARAYVQRARAAHMQVLLHVSTNDYRIKRAHLQSVATYRRHVRRLVAYFRDLGVREFGTWNEANHASQPTWDSPSHA